MRIYCIELFLLQMFPLKTEFDVEFNRRIKHDFRKYLLLTSNASYLSEEAILWTVYKMEGYKRHKKVKYGEYISHIIVMFIDTYAALEATARLNLMVRMIEAFRSQTY